MKSLADGHEKVTILTTAPAVPGAPTAAELNAGIDASLAILASDWNFAPTPSESFNERAVGEVDNPEAFGVSNGQFGATIFRQFDAGTGQVDDTADVVFAAVKVKGTTVWVYARESGKLASADWEDDDEIRYGAEVLTDTPTKPGQGGYVKGRVEGKVQKSYPFASLTPAA